MKMGYVYSTSYPDDDFPKLFGLLREIIEEKRKRQTKLERFGYLHGRIEHEREIYNFVAESLLERKDLEILHDRLVDVFNNSLFSKDKDYV